CGLQIVHLSEECELGRSLRSDCIFDHLAIDRWHRNPDRHLIQCKLQRAFFSDPIIANDRRDEPTRIGMTVDCRNGGPGIVEQAKGSSAISSEASCNLLKIAPRVHCEVVV